MAHQMLASRLSLGGSDMVADLFQATLTRTQAELDNTVFANTFKARLSGLKDVQMSVGVFDDIADNLVDEIIDGLFSAASVAVVFGIAQSFTESASNPEYQFTGLLFSDQLGGAVGEEAKRNLSLAISSGSLVRDIV